MKHLHDLIDRQSDNLKGASLLDQIAALGASFTALAQSHAVIDASFKETGNENLWIECPSCKSPVILNHIHCPYCTTNLVGGEAEEIVPPKEDKPKPAKKAKKKAAKKTAPKPEPVPVVEEIQEELDVEDTEEELEYPSVEELQKMRKPSLIKVINEFELEVDPDDYKDSKALRAAVNEAIDAVAGDEEEVEEEEEVDETPDEEDFEEEVTEDDDIDLDGIEDDDEDEDIFDEDDDEEL